MLRCLIIIAVLNLSAGYSLAQRIKSKDIKRAVEQGKITEVKLVIEDRFTPGNNQEFDLRVQLESGVTVLASEYHMLWDYVELNVDNTPYKIRGEFFANGKGVIKPRDAAAYYPDLAVRVSATLGGRKDEKLLTPLHCYPNLQILRVGLRGQSGDRGDGSESGGNGGQGEYGGSGERGPDIQLEVMEEVIAEKIHVVIAIDGKKYPFDPECSSVAVISRGGDGGSGGRGGKGGNSPKDNKNEYTRNGGRGGNGGGGGDGGDGGNITIRGSAYDKYKSKLVLRSEGGSGGDGGVGGSGGSGKSDGREGTEGRSGRNGQSGQVIINP